jgi:biotin-(acetyl-CoA carboxylase) ligase
VRSAPEVPDARWAPAALADSGDAPSRADLLVALLAALGGRYRAWLEAGPGDALAAFAAHDGLAGRQVRVSVGAETVVGEAQGIDELGRLRLRAAGGTRLMAAGEVTGVDR